MSNSVVICSRCGRALRSTGSFIDDVLAGGGSVHVLGGEDTSGYQQWLGTVCPNCSMVFCDECQDCGWASPCRNCGQPVKPALAAYLPRQQDQRSLPMDKPPFSPDSLPKGRSAEGAQQPPQEVEQRLAAKRQAILEEGRRQVQQMLTSNAPGSAGLAQPQSREQEQLVEEHRKPQIAQDYRIRAAEIVPAILVSSLSYSIAQPPIASSSLTWVQIFVVYGGQILSAVIYTALIRRRRGRVESSDAVVAGGVVGIGFVCGVVLLNILRLGAPGYFALQDYGTPDCLLSTVLCGIPNMLIIALGFSLVVRKKA
jgi:hypothetical protein